MTLPVPPARGAMTDAESDSCCAEWWRGLSRSHPGHLRARQSPAPGTAGPLTEPSEPLTEPSGALGSITTAPPPRGTAGPLREPPLTMTLNPERLPNGGDTPYNDAESRTGAECWRHSWAYIIRLPQYHGDRRHDQEKTERERQRQNGDDDMAGGEVGGRGEGGKRLAGRWRRTTKKRTDAQAQTHKRTNAYTQTST